MSSSRSTEALRDAVAALTSGAIDLWNGLPDCTQADLLAAFPSATATTDRLLHQPAVAYAIPSTRYAPYGVRVWTQQGVVTLAEVREPVLTEVELQSLGEPDAVIESGLGASLDQLLWPARGLILHRSRLDGRVAVLYGHSPSTLAEVEASPLVRVRIERRLRRS